ncbi:hypothetical protein TMRO357_02735 [Alteriqipengyuania sp. 357]
MDVRHVAALDLALEAWDRAPEYAGASQRARPRLANLLGRVFAPRTLGGLGAAAALAAAIAAVVVVMPPDRPAYAEHAAAGETEQIAMKGRSQIALAPNSRILVLSQEDARSARLVKGTAAFDVRKNGTRFSVEAGEVTVVVTGTRFEVAHDRTQTRVKLNEGSIRLTGRNFTLDSPDMASIAISGAFGLDDAVATLRSELDRKGLALKDAGDRYVIAWNEAQSATEPAPAPSDR